MSESFFSANWYRAAQLRPKLQAHVDVHRHRYRGMTWYVLHDHATGRVHRFSPAAYLLMGRMNGERTLDQIWKQAALELGEHAPSQEEVINLVARLHAADLMQAGEVPESIELLERLKRRRWSLLGRNFKNPLAITVSLLDPDRLLTVMAEPLRRIGIGRLCIGWFALVLPALVLLALHWQEWSESLPERVLAAENLLLLALVFPLVKLLHELGHGLVLKAFGGAVHDAGVMLLVLVPVPYVDASASLSFRSKYRRALVGAAGMMVELALAAIAVFVWLAAETGLVRAIAFDVVMIAGFSTLVVNGNPLLRFDGYYILSDLIEIPNLGSRSNSFWGALLEQRLFGVAPRRQDSVRPTERPWLFAYAPLAFAYRLLVFFGIALFVATEYLTVGIAIAVWSFVMGFLMPLWRVLRHLATSPTLQERRARVALVSTALTFVAAGLVLIVPAPLATVSEGVAWLPEEAQVRAGTSGFISRIGAAAGAWVNAGDPLVILSEPTLGAQLMAQQQRLAEVETRLRADEVSDRAKAVLTRQELEAERSELRRLTIRSERLVVRSARSGTFVPFNPENAQGRFVHEGAMIGVVTGDEPRIVRAVVRQDNIDLVRHHLLKVEAKVADRLAQSFDARIVREVPAAGNALPNRALGSSGGGRLATDPKDADGNTAIERVFQFDLQLDPPPQQVNYGTRVYLRFSHEWEALGRQWYRRLRQLLLSYFDA